MQSIAIQQPNRGRVLIRWAWLLLGYALLTMLLLLVELSLASVNERKTLTHLIWSYVDAHEWDGLLDLLPALEIGVLLTGLIAFGYSFGIYKMVHNPSRSFRSAVKSYLLLIFVAVAVGLTAKHTDIMPCRSNLMQISEMLNFYTVQHNGRFPQSYADLMAYNENGHFLTEQCCPDTVEPYHIPGGYGVNGHLFGLTVRDISDPSKVIAGADSVRQGMVLMSERDLADHRHHVNGKRGCFVVYLDGHQAFLPAGTPVRWK